MDRDLIARLGVPVPRYTSYPTANHFNPRIGPAETRAWLSAIAPSTPLSLYAHIPFCRELCWYCGCSTKATRRYAPVMAYLDVVEAELAQLAAHLPERGRLVHIHFGGGSPDILKAPEIVRLGEAIARHFDRTERAEVAVEIDPRILAADQADAFAAIGVNRISLGVQDFDPAVQKAIGRIQGYDDTARVVDLFRTRGVRSINIDLVYGLPNQTEASVLRTLHQVLDFAPDRIAIFGYAHLPERLKHQRLIDSKALPGPAERFAQSRALAQSLETAGYVAIGLDHFARRGDSLASGHLARNFQGYTTDQAEVLLGVGASAISRFPQGYAQNAVAIEDYGRRIEAQRFATARGWALSDDDRTRAFVIERLMCDFSFSEAELTRRFGAAAAPVIAEARDFVAADADALVVATDDGFDVTARGRPFVRNICAAFDAYLPRDTATRRHALAV